MLYGFIACMLLYYGAWWNIYKMMIKHDYEFESAEKLGVDLTDLDNLPEYAIGMLAEKWKQKTFEIEKEHKISKIEESFDEFWKSRFLKLIEERRMKGL